MQLTAGNSGKPVPLGSSGNEVNQDSDGYDIQIESGITDKSNSPDKMGYSLPTDIANYAESSKEVLPALRLIATRLKLNIFNYLIRQSLNLPSK